MTCPAVPGRKPECIGQDGLGDEPIRARRSGRIPHRNRPSISATLKSTTPNTVCCCWKGRNYRGPRDRCSNSTPRKKSLPRFLARRAAGTKSTLPNCPKSMSKIGLTMNSHCGLRHPMMGRISIAKPGLVQTAASEVVFKIESVEKVPLGGRRARRKAFAV